MILMLLDLPTLLCMKTESALMHFPLSPSCARITIDVPSSRLQCLMPAIIYILNDRHMRINLYLLLDFKEIFSHSTH